MVNKFSKFRLQAQQKVGIVIEVKDIASNKDECEHNLLGKIWGSKAANFTGFKKTLHPLWCQKDETKDRVMLKRSWIFDNQFVVVTPWNPKLKADDP